MAAQITKQYKTGLQIITNLGLDLISGQDWVIQYISDFHTTAMWLI